MESVQATVEFIRTNMRFLEPLPRRLKGFTVFVKRFADNRQWDHFVSFKWTNYTPPRWQPLRLWQRPAMFSNPACQTARDTKIWRWCKVHVTRKRDCDKSPWLQERCNATCNGC